MKSKTLARGGNTAHANVNTPASVATAAPLPCPKPAKPRKTHGKAADGASSSGRHRKPAPSTPPVPSPAPTVAIPRKMAEYIADGELNAMEGITTSFTHDTAGYLKCLRDNIGTLYEQPAIEYATNYRAIMLALGKGDDLPEPRRYVKRMKTSAVAIPRILVPWLKDCVVSDLSMYGLGGMNGGGHAANYRDALDVHAQGNGFPNDEPFIECAERVRAFMTAIGEGGKYPEPRAYLQKLEHGANEEGGA